MYKVTVTDLFTDCNENPVFTFAAFIPATQMISAMIKQGYKVVVEQEGEGDE